MKRIPEPELMLRPEQVIAYAEADFEWPHSNFIRMIHNKFPNAEVTPIAKKTLAFMDKESSGKGGPMSKRTPKNDLSATSSGETPDGDLANPSNPIYRGFSQKVKPSDKIFVLMYVDKNKISKVEANSKVSDFNKKLYAAQKLKVFTFLYKNTHLLPYISNFKKVEDAATETEETETALRDITDAIVRAKN